ncbi:MAG: chemotaxis protein [Ramlibacter sp.]|jgi:methyl-accepting chemotaxis protein|nr:chemotaxis protein [Ramlibacter sp.]
MLSRISVFSRLLALTIISLFALAAVGTIGILSTGAVQDMQSRTEAEAVKPIEQIGQLNELMQEAFRELLLAVQHNPAIPAVKFHNHSVQVHADALEKALQTKVTILQDYRNSRAGKLYPEQIDRVEAAEVKLADALRQAAKLVAKDEAEGYSQLGIDVTVKVLPLFKEAKKQAAELLDKHKKLSREISQAAEDQYNFSRTSIMIGCGVIFAIVLGGAILIGRSITGPLGELTEAMTALAGGRSDVQIPCLARKDEVGNMAATVKIFKGNILETERLRTEQSETEGRQAQQRKADMVNLANEFESAVGAIIETVSASSSELETSARTLAATAARSEELTDEVATASGEATTNVQSVASATEQMASSVNEISRQVQESARMAGEAVEQARSTNARVSELSKAAARIGDVVELINTIAGQTNLLALNATIEAARAGEAGRGFAVVASEVKALAEQTSKATGEIGQQISGIQTATAESVNAIKEIGNTIEKLSGISSTIAAAVEEQGAATREISRNVQQAADGTRRVSTNIADVQRGATDTGSASSQVFAAAQTLSGDSNRLKAEVGKFLGSIKVA